MCFMGKSVWVEENEKEFKEYDWSSTIYLKNRRNVLKRETCDLNYTLTTATTTLISAQNNFSKIFRIAYQKCIYGPLTFIPRLK